ncbi:hypothetical protein EYF80_029290 [Liparis tanakae]|uniref:Uncharacterized protein n=1 Tax=Liparis tanakae TaxID=230148 RepID=A0A4Z2H3W0_9TELE|nr:hypothetical protein EYF80_029290 [Liparis tanakae]
MYADKDGGLKCEAPEEWESIGRQQRAEAQQRQVGHRVALLPLRPVLPEASGGRRRRGGQVAVVVVVVEAVVDGFGNRAAAAVAPDQKLPPVAAVVQQPGRHQQHQDEEAEQEEEHVDGFGLRGRVGAAACTKTGSRHLVNIWTSDCSGSPHLHSGPNRGFLPAPGETCPGSPACSGTNEALQAGVERLVDPRAPVLLAHLQPQDVQHPGAQPADTTGPVTQNRRVKTGGCKRHGQRRIESLQLLADLQKHTSVTRRRRPRFLSPVTPTKHEKAWNREHLRRLPRRCHQRTKAFSGSSSERDRFSHVSSKSGLMFTSRATSNR